MNEKEIALYCKRMEMESLEKAKKYKGDGTTYWSGKTQAFSQVWEYIVFDGKKVGDGVTPQEYNKQNELWSKEAGSE